MNMIISCSPNVCGSFKITQSFFNASKYELDLKLYRVVVKYIKQPVIQLVMSRCYFIDIGIGNILIQIMFHNNFQGLKKLFVRKLFSYCISHWFWLVTLYSQATPTSSLSSQTGFSFLKLFNFNFWGPEEVVLYSISPEKNKNKKMIFCVAEMLFLSFLTCFIISDLSSDPLRQISGDK